MRVPLLDLHEQLKPLRDDILAGITEVLDSTGYIMGPKVEALEMEVASYCQAKHGIGVTSGTDALLAVLMALGIGPGDLVLTTPYTFVATIGCILRLGARPLFADIDPITFNIDPAKAADVLSHPNHAGKIKAILPVHLYGQCADMTAIKKIADKHKLKLIEDNAQAIGAAGPGFKIGQLSDVATTSFIIQKNLGTFGDSGALVTNNAEIDAAVRRLRNHGSTARNVHSFGFNSRLDDLHAGILSAKLKHIDEYNNQRRKWADRYTAGLKGSTTFDLPVALPGYRHVFHLYVIETKQAEQRDKLVDFLVANGVDAKTHYSIAIHKQAGYPWGKNARVVGPVTNAEANAACCVSLPMFPELTADEVDYVIAKVKEWDRANAAAGSAQPGAAQCGPTCACCR